MRGPVFDAEECVNKRPFKAYCLLTGRIIKHMVYSGNSEAKMTEFSSLLGKTLTAIDVSPTNNEIIFKANDGRSYRMWHDQDCCESVSIEDVVGDWADLIGNPILVAEEATDTNSPKTETGNGYSWTDESSTWTFYKLATIKGHVDVRWYGSSNGYYSEGVDFAEIEAPSGCVA